MDVEIISKPAFCVIGKEGSTDMGEGFVQKLWSEANLGFAKISDLALKGEDGRPIACWGAMSDFSMRFLPWEDNFTRGKYLAGVECLGCAAAPAGWKRWDIPAFQYIKIRCNGENTFALGFEYMAGHGCTLAGAVQDFTDMQTGQNYMLFPIKRL